MFRLSIYLCFLLLFLSTCRSPVEDIFNPDMVKIYMQTPQGSNVIATDVMATSDGGYLIFGLWGERMGTRPDAQGALYLVKTDASGKMQWDSCYKQYTGLPSNVLETGGNEYVFFMNRGSDTSARALRVVLGNNAATTQVSSRSLDCGGTGCGFITRFITSIDGNHFVLLNLTMDQLNPNLRNLNLIQMTKNFEFVQKLSQRSFSPERFGSVSNDELGIIQRVSYYLHLGKNNQHYFFTAPVDDKMTLLRVGEVLATYLDKNYWITAIDNSGDDRVSLVITNPNQGGQDAYFVSNLDLFPNQSSQSSVISDGQVRKRAVDDMGILSKVLMWKSGNDKTLVAGTSSTGQVLLNYYQDTGTDVAGRSITLASGSNRYEVAGLAASAQGNKLALVGSTRFSTSVQRIFLIIFDQKEL